MAETPDGLLARARQARADMRDHVTFAPRKLAEAWDELDALLSAGGPLPAAWYAKGGMITEGEYASPPRVVPQGKVYDVTLTTAGEEFYQVPGSRLREMRDALAGKDAEIARLTAELDAARNTPVEYVPAGGLEAAMAADPDREDGCVLREMGGERRAFAWKAATGEWEQIA
jgi:hypothetical protein